MRPTPVPWRRRLSVKIGLTTLAIVFVQSVLLLFWAYSFARNVRKSSVEAVANSIEMARCNSSPETWMVQPTGDARIVALRDDGTPFHPDITNINAGAANADSPGFVDDALPPRAGIVYESGRADRCHRLFMEFGGVRNILGGKRRGYLITRLIIDFAVIVAVIGFIAIPLVRRVRRMSSEAATVVETGFDGAVSEGEDELGVLGQRFNLAARTAKERLTELQRREELLRTSLGDLAHDVRIPLTSLKLGLSELPADKGLALRAEVEYLDAMFSNLSSLVQLEGSTIRLEEVPVDMARLVERVALRFSVTAGDREVAIEAAAPEESLWVTGDPVALEQVVGNLVHNAVKFAGSEVIISAYGRAERIIVEVLDDGPGVPFEHLPRLTERNFRGNRNADDTGRPGQGLGLAIANELTLRHAGTLTLTRADDGGTLAAVALPRIQPG